MESSKRPGPKPDPRRQFYIKRFRIGTNGRPNRRLKTVIGQLDQCSCDAARRLILGKSR
jgi:hypothetical protein